MGETLTSTSEVALVNRLRGRGRPKKTQTQRSEVDLLHSIMEEENLESEKTPGDNPVETEEGAEYDSRYSNEGSSLPPTPPLEYGGALNLSSSTPKRVNTSRKDLSLEVPPGMDFIMLT